MQRDLSSNSWGKRIEDAKCKKQKDAGISRSLFTTERTARLRRLPDLVDETVDRFPERLSGAHAVFQH